MAFFANLLSTPTSQRSGTQSLLSSVAGQGIGNVPGCLSPGLAAQSAHRFLFFHSTLNQRTTPAHVLCSGVFSSSSTATGKRKRRSEREGGRERHTQRQRQRNRDREREEMRQTDRQTETHTERNEREKLIDTPGEMVKEWKRE